MRDRQFPFHFADTVAIRWQRGDCAFFRFLDNTIPWVKFHHLCAQTATLLQQKNVKPSDCVAFVGNFRLTSLLVYCSVQAMGAKVLMLNPAMPQSQRETLLADIGVNHLFDDSLFAEFSENLTAYSFPNLDFNAPATLTLTSGSSGLPKAVVHSIDNHRHSAKGVVQLMATSHKQARWQLSLPLFHVSGQSIVWRWLCQAATLLVNEDKNDFFTTLAQATHVSLVPTQLQRYLTRLDSEINKEQHILLGGAHIPSELVFQAKAKGIQCYQGYGMTEAASTICAIKNEIDNVGKPLEWREVRIVNDEIQIRGEILAKGYWKQGELMSLPLTEDGWFATKDRGEWTAQGKLKVLGRLDNMFISGGENIQPENIEAVLYAAGGIETVFVVPVPDLEFGVRPIAFVKFEQAFSEQAVEKLQHFATQYLERFKLPIRYLPLESERFAAGIKISRKQLQEYAVEIQGEK